MTPVVSYAELARTHPDDPVLTAKALDLALSNCAQAGRVAAAVLGLARVGQFHVEHGRAPIKGEVGSLHSGLTAAELAMGRPLASDRITLRRPPSDISLALPQVLLDQVLLNILLNARLAMTRGGAIEVTVSTSGTLATVVIEDDGPGFDSEAAGESRGAGHGLGLVFCSRVVEEYGGTFLVESQIGTGTRVTIVAPVAASIRDVAA